MRRWAFSCRDGPQICRKFHGEISWGYNLYIYTWSLWAPRFRSVIQISRWNLKITKFANLRFSPRLAPIQTIWVCICISPFLLAHKPIFPCHGQIFGTFWTSSWPLPVVMPGDPDFSEPPGPTHLQLQRDTFEVPAFQLLLLQFVYLRERHDQ